jgi:hypothetical protein
VPLRPHAPLAPAGSLASQRPSHGDSRGGGTQAPRPRKLLLLDDLPHAHDAAQRQRLAQALRELVATARGPAVIIATELGSAGTNQGAGASTAVGGIKGLHKVGGSTRTCCQASRCLWLPPFSHTRAHHSRVACPATVLARERTHLNHRSAARLSPPRTCQCPSPAPSPEPPRLQDILAAVDSLGCQTISFNPVPPTSITKHLKAIAAQRGLSADPATLASVAQAADGDLRSAVLTMQMMFTGRGGTGGGGGGAAAAAGAIQRAKRGAGGAGKRGRAAAQDGAQAAATAASLAAAHKDMGLNLFHFLGRVLYNKREGDEGEEEGAGAAAAAAGAPAAGGGGGSKSRKTSKAGTASSKAAAVAAQQAAAAPQLPARPLQQRYQRPALRYNPEAILAQSGMEALPVAAFLHENYTEFIEQEAMEDVAAAAGYLSDAAALAGHRNSAMASSVAWGGGDEGAAFTLADAAAGSTAVRGLLFANAHPAPRRWLPLRSPVSGLVGRAAAANLAELRATLATAAALAISSSCWASLEAYAAGALVYARRLAAAPGYGVLQALLPPRWSHVWNGAVQERGQRAAGAAQAQQGWGGLQQQAGQQGGEGEGEEEDEIEEED